MSYEEEALVRKESCFSDEQKLELTVVMLDGNRGFVIFYTRFLKSFQNITCTPQSIRSNKSSSNAVLKVHYIDFLRSKLNV